MLSLLYPLSLPQNCYPSKDFSILSSSLFAFIKKPFDKILLVVLPLNALEAESSTCKDDGFIFLADCLVSDCWSV